MKQILMNMTVCSVLTQASCLDLDGRNDDQVRKSCIASSAAIRIVVTNSNPDASPEDLAALDRFLLADIVYCTTPRAD